MDVEHILKGVRCINQSACFHRFKWRNRGDRKLLQALVLNPLTVILCGIKLSAVWERNKPEMRREGGGGKVMAKERRYQWEVYSEPVGVLVQQ